MIKYGPPKTLQDGRKAASGTLFFSNFANEQVLCKQKTIMKVFLLQNNFCFMMMSLQKVKKLDQDLIKSSSSQTNQGYEVIWLFRFHKSHIINDDTKPDKYLSNKPFFIQDLLSTVLIQLSNSFLQWKEINK